MSSVERNLVFSSREIPLEKGDSPSLDFNLELFTEVVAEGIPTLPTISPHISETFKIESEVSVPEALEIKSEEVIYANVVHVMSNVASGDPRTLAEAMKQTNWPAIKEAMEDKKSLPSGEA
ncbi:hypothetical protein BC835DRAFT_1415997 [Cytidiella melzeri]|nr:hypothetical protein BC835DRAFT_1415997 [Cytidiella melzeri]